MKAYPLELRQRIVDAVERKVDTIARIAEMFGVTERYIYLLMARWRSEGDLTPRPHGGGASLKTIDARVAALVEADPEATLEELARRYNARRRVKVGVTAIWSSLKRQGITRKKRPAARPKPIQRHGQNS
jgi:transposase